MSGSIDEKRVYGATRDATTAVVGSELGATRVGVSGDRVGRVELVHRGPVSDVAGGDGRLLVATPEDVLVGTDEAFEPTGFGEAVAVGVESDILAAGPDGRVGRLAGDDWREVGTVAEPRRFDAPLLAAGSGIHRVDADGLESLGLADARDAAAAGPDAATADGLYGFADGEWELEHGEPCSVVAAGDGRAHAVAGERLLKQRDGEWVPCEVPTDEPVVDVAYGEAAYAVTAEGTFLIDADPAMAADGGGGWRGRALGLPGVTAVAVP